MSRGRLIAGLLFVALSATSARAAHLTSFEVVERAGVARSQGVVDAGFPLARGSVASPPVLDVHEGGQSLPVALRPLAWWDDGSVRFVQLRFPLTLAANEAKTLTLESSAGVVYAPVTPALPPLVLEIVSDGLLHSFALVDGFDDTSGNLRVRAWIDSLTDGRARLRVWMAQQLEDASWSRVSLALASPGTPVQDPAGRAIGNSTLAFAVRHAVERGVTFEGSGAELIAHLYPDTAPVHAADEGFHVSAEALIEWGASPSDLADRIDKPLRVAFEHDWVTLTGAVGSIAPGGVDPLQEAAAGQSLLELKQNQASNARNRGWTAYGDFFDRSNRAYLGYLLQEYDPATGLFLHAMRTGDADALDFALRQARQYADSGLSLAGGSSQHRATSWALVGLVSRPAADALMLQWRTLPGIPATDAEVLAFAQLNGFESLAQEAIDATSETDAVRRERAIARYTTFDRADAGIEDYRAELEASCGTSSTTPPTGGIGERVHGLDPGTWARGCADASELADFARIHSQAYFLAQIGIVQSAADLDALAVAFAARYGGDLGDTGFPGFHFWNHPDEARRHSGGHMLLEQVVYGALLSGDPILEEFARLAIDYQSSDAFIDREIAVVEAQIANPAELIRVRRLGWPLLNLVAASSFSEGRDPVLHARVIAAMDRLAASIVNAPDARWRSLIHVAVGTEALARYVELTGNAAAAAKLVSIATHWSNTYWNNQAKAFAMGPADPGQIIPALSVMFLQGLATAADLSGDPVLVTRAQAIYDEHGLASSGFAKTVGMLLRNTPRAQATAALGLVTPLPGLVPVALVGLAALLAATGAIRLRSTA